MDRRERRDAALFLTDLLRDGRRERNEDQTLMSLVNHDMSERWKRRVLVSERLFLPPAADFIPDSRRLTREETRVWRRSGREEGDDERGRKLL